jgi:2-keto-4-pentenoate hydratase/2-oxohepta-3-ene-1,7-dioic acid hydratase in catechol pathway
MKFARFEHDGHQRLGIIQPDKARIRSLKSDTADLRELIGTYEPGQDVPAAGEWLDLADVRLLAPFQTTWRNIICVGKNYREHAKEFARSGFEAGATADVDPFPAVFTKPSSCIVGPGAEVNLHSAITQSVDYEAELAIIIGKSGRNISKSDAYNHVWGYTIINDVTARDRQKNHKQWFLGKALDTFCPMGPWVATKDELEPEDLNVKTWVNGELRQSANTRDMIFTIPVLIETISAGMALQPGDVIATGTPSGVGLSFDPHKFLRPGDEVRISIDGLGTLTNTFM